MNFTNLLASIKVRDILKEPPSPEDHEVIIQLRSDPLPNSASLFDLLSQIQVVEPTTSSLSNKSLVGTSSAKMVVDLVDSSSDVGHESVTGEVNDEQLFYIYCKI